MKRKYPIGAELIANKGVHFRVFAPDHKTVALVLEEGDTLLAEYPMKRERGGYFSLLCKEAKENSHYRFRLGGATELVSDPASRHQPYGVGGPSAVINPAYPWKDGKWKGIGREGHVVYEMHIGTYTQEGTFKAAMQHLKELASIGITVIEVMPLNTFPGTFGWGYDGVSLFAPMHTYGSPRDVKAFIDRAHQLGMGVILDVVYNHLGPEGNQMPLFAKEYLNEALITDWGIPVNFDSKPSREFFLTNARYWIEEFHFDGLRVDSTHCFFCTTPKHILAELTQVCRKAGGRRSVFIVGEDETQNAGHLRPYKRGGDGFDALWNEDFHHAAHVRLTGKREAYYTDFLGTPQEFISTVKFGYLYQGQYNAWYKGGRGKACLDLPKEAFVIFLENHDQVSNSPFGTRLLHLSDLGNFKAMSCLLLLSPSTPMLFQGQEYGSSRPFFYFADHARALGERVFEGRKEYLSRFPRLATREILKLLPDPADPRTFVDSKLDHEERKKNKKIYDLHRDLLKLRRGDPLFSKAARLPVDGAVIGRDSFLIRYFGSEKEGDRLLLFNFGPDHHFQPAPEPLLVAGDGREWEVIWSSTSPRYGGEGTPPINTPSWKILGHSAIVLRSRKATSRRSSATGGRE